MSLPVVGAPSPWAGELAGLLELSRMIRSGVRRHVASAIGEGSLAALAHHAAEGVGDVTFALDEPAERAVEAWMHARALRGPLSVLTEDTGWRHVGPAPSGGWQALGDFDHGGPRIAFDPIDGTRNLLGDLRSGWVVVSFCDPGPAAPHLSDVTGGLLVEIPPSLGGCCREIWASRGNGCQMQTSRIVDGSTAAATPGLPGPLRVDDSDRCDHGYFPFFRYAPAVRPAIARVEAAFFKLLEAELGADIRHCWDDQSCASADQLVHLMTGRYRMLCDLRPRVELPGNERPTPTKPYDVAGAMLCAAEAGVVLTDTHGAELDFELDCVTPVDWIGYANGPTAAKLAGPLSKAILAESPLRA